MEVCEEVKLRVSVGAWAEPVSERISSECVRVVVHEGGGESVKDDLVGAGEAGADAKLRGDQDASSPSSRAVSASATCSRSLASLDASSSDCDMGAWGGRGKGAGGRTNQRTFRAG